MASIMNMPMPSVTYPCFMSVNRVKREQVHDNGVSGSIPSGIPSGDGDFDFDLLAEYLLDEVNANETTQFDFRNENLQTTTQGQTGVVSPDQTGMIFADPLADQAHLTQPDLNITESVKQVNELVHGTPSALALPPQTLQIRPTSAPLAPTPGIGPLAPAPPPLALKVPSSVPVPLPSPRLDLSRLITHQHKRPRVESKLSDRPVVHGNFEIPQRAIVPPRVGGRKKSQAQIDRRRERNRILARRTRLRKKFFFESLQKDVTDLQKENMALKEIVRSRISAKEAKPILERCKAMEEIPSVVLQQCGDLSMMDRQDFNLCTAINKSQRCFVITDPSLQDNPIVYVSDDFLTLTGYSRPEVLGRNCRFLQGAETCKKKMSTIRDNIENGNDVSVTFVNYKADGTAFWNKLFIAALRDAQNNIVNFIGVTVKVAGPEPDDPEAGKMLPGENSCDGNQSPGGCDNNVDADAAVMAIEGAVTAAVAAAPPIVTNEIKVEGEE